jgi:hypothetical protein
MSPTIADIGGASNVSTSPPRRKRLFAIAAIFSLIASIGLSQSAQAATPQAKPKISLIGFGSQLTINGTPYEVDPKSHQLKPSTALASSTFPPSGYHKFTRAVPYWSFSDSNGEGYQQVSYATNTEQWGYSISTVVRRIVVGNVTQFADLWHGSGIVVHFGQHIVPADYFFHGSSGSVSHSGTYAVTFRASFKCNVGSNCSGVLNAKWTWLFSNS